MASLMDQTSSPPALLKNKLNHIRDLLDDANHRLHQEAKIFTTKASASSSAAKTNLNGRINAQQHPPADELRRTITDISTIQSVLSCPIFNQIANVTDSLDRLSYHLNLRPSIGPTDIEFNDNGEIILAPPIEPTSLNNLINSRLDDYTNCTSPQRNSNSTNFNSMVITEKNLVDQHSLHDEHQQQNKQNYYNDSQATSNQENESITLNEPLHEQRNMVLDKHPDQSNAQSNFKQPNEYDTERLVANGRESNYVNGGRQRKREPTKVQSVVAVFENADALASSGNENRRLYKTNGHHALNQTGNDARRNVGPVSLSSNGQASITDESLQNMSYTNGSYKISHEIAHPDLPSKANQRPQAQSNVYPLGLRNQQQPDDAQQQDLIADSKSSLVKTTNINHRASPSTSAGSTVRLADECDSGTSSFRSKGALYSPQSQRPIAQLDEDQVVSSSAHSSIDQELIEKLSPDMERIKVTLEKDAGGLGITIAGYTCEQEEISGIFIKSITPGSPADRSGKIRILDQIFAVNGQEILAYSNPEAVNVLRRQTSRVVTLELMRYLAESKYKKLQTLLERAAPSSSLQKTLASIGPSSVTPMEVDVQPTKAQPVMSSFSPKNSAPSQTVESMYNNTSVLMAQQSFEAGSNAASPIPVAAQRLGTTTNKVIETKQGARNRIDIRSPLCQATYVNEIPPPEFNGSSDANTAKSVTERLRQEVSDEFSRLVGTEKLEWEKNVQIVELRRDSTKSLGFTVKDYTNPKDPQRSIFMIVSITPGSITDLNGQLSVGDLLVFVDDTNLEYSTPNEAVKALRRASGQVRLGILKYKQQR